MKILLTGANGYIGKRLLPLLIEKGCKVYCVVRNKNRLNVNDYILSKITIVEADFLSTVDNTDLPTDIDAAFFLIHSMSSSNKNFDDLEAITAWNFIEYINRTQAKQVLYLGGIYNDNNLSKHLASRYNVEKILSKSNVPLTVLRAGIILGSGSASFETIRNLVEKIPILIGPRWLETRSQPIAIRNVVDYLCQCLLNEKTYNRVFDIGGPDILTYKQMLIQFAEVRGYKRFVASFPVPLPRLSSYWLSIITSISYNLTKNLVDSLKNEIIVKNDEIRELIPSELIDFKTAVKLAFDKIQQNMVVSSWTDAMASGMMNVDVNHFVEVPIYGCFIDKKIKSFNRNPEEVMQNIWAIGGERGWYSSRFLWKIRGIWDKIIGGVGLRRGRRSPTEINTGDALDFWRVLLASKEKRRLLLYAEMKLPGEAWLELSIVEKNNQHFLYQTATFRPYGLAGRLYWYSVSPFHQIIFNSMIRNIINFGKRK